MIPVGSRIPGRTTWWSLVSIPHLLQILSYCLCIRQRNTTNRIYLSFYLSTYLSPQRERVVYFKELAHVIVETWQVQNLQGRVTDWRPREELQFDCKDCLLVEFLLSRVRSVFSVVRSSTDWTRLIYIIEVNQLSAKLIDLNINPPPPQIFTNILWNIQNVWPLSWVPWSGQTDIKLAITVLLPHTCTLYLSKCAWKMKHPNAHSVLCNWHEVP